MQISISEKHCKRSGRRTLSNNRRKRDNHGWSLAGTLIISVIISLFLAAMWSTLLPAYLHITNLRYKDAARAANEAAVDNIIAQLNTGALVPPAHGSPTVINTTSMQGAASFNVTTTLTNYGSGPSNFGPPTNCIMYSPNRSGNNNFYLLSSNVTKGTLSRTLNIVLNPIVPAAPTSPFGNGGAFGVSTVNQVGLACLNGYNLPAGWNNPYQFSDTTVAKGVTWQIGNGQLDRSQIIAGSQFEFWHPGDSPPALPAGTSAMTYEPFTQIMGNVYSNYTDQNGANGNGYWPRNQLTGNNAKAPNGDPTNANVFGAANGTNLAAFGGTPTGVPSGFQAGQGSNLSIPIPTGNSWGLNAATNANGTVNFAANLPLLPSGQPNLSYAATPQTGGYIASPGAAGTAGSMDNWQFPAPPVAQAPGAPSGVPAPATGGLGVPNTTGTYFSNAPQSIVVNGGTLNITNGAAAPPASLSVSPGQTVNIPPGNYNISSLQVVNGGSITIDPAVQGQTQLFVTPSGTGQGTSGAVYIDNTSSVNMTGITATNGFTSGGTKGFGKNLPSNQPAVDTANPITETAGSALNLTINTNSQCNMLFAGNSRALVNAPNANVNIGYQPNPGNKNSYTSNSQSDPAAVMSKDANFYGAVVGGNVSVVSDYSSGAGAFLHYDVKLKKIDSKPGQPVTFNKPLNWYDPWMFASTNPNAPSTQWRAASWQEQLGAW